MTPNKLKQIKSRRRKITSGKWVQEGESVIAGDRTVVGAGSCGCCWPVFNTDTQDAHFIANAPSDIDVLVAEIERLWAARGVKR